MPQVVLLVNTVITLLILTLVLRIIMANVVLLVGKERMNPFVRSVGGFLIEVTEPILAPIRKLLPTTRLRVDLAPLIAIIALDLLGRLLTQALLRVL